LTGIGGYLPENLVSNDELSRRVDTSDAWITERTGIRQRHFAAPFETAGFMGAAAARVALAAAGVAAAAVDAIVLATSTPDQAFPATAVHVQAALGAHHAFGFDISAACSGFIYGLSVADAMIRAGQVNNVLVIGSEVYSRILNFADRGTCVLFGDGAGAVLLQARNTGRDGAGILSTHLHSDGRLADILYVDGAVGRPEKPGHLVMNGREVFRHAVNLLSSAVSEALSANDLKAADIDWLVPHQANRRYPCQYLRRLDPPGTLECGARRPHQTRPTRSS
jgi:3-oxoacyl-[acyl-carrier-protein] synthase-3